MLRLAAELDAWPGDQEHVRARALRVAVDAGQRALVVVTKAAEMRGRERAKADERSGAEPAQEAGLRDRLGHP